MFVNVMLFLLTIVFLELRIYNNINYVSLGSELRVGDERSGSV
jgi:hypothetical protein